MLTTKRLECDLRVVTAATMRSTSGHCSYDYCAASPPDLADSLSIPHEGSGYHINVVLHAKADVLRSSRAVANAQQVMISKW